MKWFQCKLSFRLKIISDKNLYLLLINIQKWKEDVNLFHSLVWFWCFKVKRNKLLNVYYLLRWRNVAFCQILMHFIHLLICSRSRTLKIEKLTESKPQNKFKRTGFVFLYVTIAFYEHLAGLVTFVVRLSSGPKSTSRYSSIHFIWLNQCNCRCT